MQYYTRCHNNRNLIRAAKCRLLPVVLSPFTDTHSMLGLNTCGSSHNENHSVDLNIQIAFGTVDIEKNSPSHSEVGIATAI